MIERYVDEYTPKEYVFEGVEGGKPYSSSSVQKLVRRATKAAGISKRVTPHMLRHCFGIHLLDSGTDLRYIKELLGHNDIKTTLIYTHVTNKDLSKIISPLDDLDL